MLAPQVEAPFADPFFELALLGRAEHAPLAAALLDDVGLDVEYRRTGILRVARTESERADLQRQLRWQSARGLAAEWVESDELGAREPLLQGVAGRLAGGRPVAGGRGPGARSATGAGAGAGGCSRGAHACSRARGRLVWTMSGERVTGVQTPAGVCRGDTVVLAAGVWSPDLARGVGLELPVAPVKGQVLSLRALGRAPRQVIWSGECYLVPRPGRRDRARRDRGGGQLRRAAHAGGGQSADRGGARGGARGGRLQRGRLLGGPAPGGAGPLPDRRLGARARAACWWRRRTTATACCWAR